MFEGDNLNTDSDKLGQFCRFNKKLINAYIFITDLDNSTELKLENDLTNDCLVNAWTFSSS